MKQLFTVFLICKALLFTVSAQNAPAIIPKPKLVKMAGGQVTVSDITQLVIPQKNPGLSRLAEQYAGVLGLQKYKITESATPSFAQDKSLVFQLMQRESSKEYYSLTITKNGILVLATTERGFFYALQTLIQLLESQDPQKGALILPFIYIEDEPAFSYRGMHLDVARHFFTVEQVKQYLDLMARYKMNYFHWHLTDDQGWRIEIKKFPLLTEVGAWRKGTHQGHAHDKKAGSDNKPYGGYYTQAEISEVVRYAAERQIEVIPEIEMPGHSSAALAAYPEFGCTGGPYAVETRWGVFSDVFCTKDTSLWFVKEILNEVCSLFPGKYIHIGGDEVPRDRWKACNNCQAIRKRLALKNEDELQSYFIEQVGNHLFNKGKALIGWDEILDGGLAPNATVMSWRGVKGGIEAAKMKHNVIMCPGSHCYFDHYQSESPREPLAIGGFTNLEKVYSFNPVPEELKPAEARYVLGAQGNLWTEYIPDVNHLLYMAFPRAIALAEVLWTPASERNYLEFADRLRLHARWFQKNKINFSHSYLDLGYRTHTGKDGVEFSFVRPPVPGRILIESEKPEEGIVQDYTLSDTFLLDKSIEFAAWYQLPDNSLGRSLRLNYQHPLAAGKNINLLNSPSERYPGMGVQCLVNGFSAPETRYGGNEWIGLEGQDLEATIDLGAVKDLSQVSVQFFNAASSWIYLPVSLVILSSEDGKNYKEIARTVLAETEDRVIRPSVSMPEGSKSRYLRISAPNYGLIPKGKPGGGHKAWLFIGEIIVE